MADFGLVLFKEDRITGKHDYNKNENPFGKLFKKMLELLYKVGFFKLSVFTRLYCLLNREKFKNGLSSRVLYDNVCVWQIELPFSIRNVSFYNWNCLSNYINNICSEKHINCCLYPERVYDIIGYEHKTKHKYIAKLILKSLLVHVLESIYEKAAIRMENIDIAIVPDKEEELLVMLKILEPKIKYITILSKSEEKERYENELNDLFVDTGLSFSVSTDLKNILRNSALVINLGNPLRISNLRLNRKSLVVNLNEAEDARLQGENIVINGIVFDIINKNARDLVYATRGFYNKKELCETILAQKLEIDGNSKPDYELMDRIWQEFVKGQYCISGFEGHRGIISLENVAKAVSM